MKGNWEVVVSEEKNVGAFYGTICVMISRDLKHLEGLALCLVNPPVLFLTLLACEMLSYDHGCEKVTAVVWRKTMMLNVGQ